MSKLFFDHLIDLSEVDLEIKKIASSIEEREELTSLVDEMIHHRVIGYILDNLPRERHDEFLQIFHKCPHDETLIISYLKDRINENIEELIKNEIDSFGGDILNEIKT